MKDNQGTTVNIVVENEGQNSVLKLTINGTINKIKFPTQLKVPLAHALLTDVLFPSEPKSNLIVPRNSLIR